MRVIPGLAHVPAGFFSGWMERVTARRAAGPDTRLGNGQIFILPTRFGLLAALVVFTTLLVALNYQNSLAFLLAFLLGTLGMVAMVACHRQLRGLHVHTLEATPVFADESALLRLEVSNPGRVARHGLHLIVGRAAGATAQATAGASTVLAARLPPHARGRYRLRGTRLASDEPFGTFHAWTQLRQPVELVVYPRPVPAAPPPPGSAGESGRGAMTAAEPEDFTGLTRYRQGDRPGQIAWNAYARRGELHRKAFSSHPGGTVWLDLANTSGADDETRLSVLARRLLDSAHQGAAWGLRLPGYELGPARGSAHLERCLRALALYPGPYDDG